MTGRMSRFKDEPVIVIGSGIAGLLLSIELADNGCRVILVTKDRLEQSNTAWAQGGLAAVTGANAADTKEQHLNDTIAAGDGLTDSMVAQSIIADGAKLVRKLAQNGVEFDPSSLALEGGHKLARVLHSADATGKAIIGALTETARKNKKIVVLERCFLKDILIEDSHGWFPSRRACGAVVMVPDERLHDGAREVVLEARAVVLATGGLGQVYSRTTNPGTATGDGIAAAYRAGAYLVDMEFVQFHPTALHLPGAPAFLISEAARGAGALLLDKHGKRFAQKYHRAGELATRDVVSRAIYSCMKEDGTDSVWLDMTGLGKDKVEKEFPNIVAKLRSFGINPVEEPIPVSPAAHYFMGGVLTDDSGCTSVTGLYAIGECASTGLHGANRLASNSLLEGGVMALKLSAILSENRIRVGERSPMQYGLDEAFRFKVNSSDADMRPIDPSFIPRDFNRERFAHDLLVHAGLVRTEQGLKTVTANVLRPAPITVPAFHGNDFATECKSVSPMVRMESESAFTLGMLICQSALSRRESRGAHWRQDHPKRNDSKYQSRLIVDRMGYHWLPITSSQMIPQLSIASSKI